MVTDYSTHPEYADFWQALRSSFSDAETANHVIDAMHHLQISVPEDKESFLSATDGVLIFDNDCGVVIRIERAELNAITHRINDNPFILQPLASIPAKKAIIEICPGTHGHAKIAKHTEIEVREMLESQKVDFWDCAKQNMGVLPIKTPAFPNGVPVIIDRLSVGKLSAGVTLFKSQVAREWSKTFLKKLFNTAAATLKNDPQKQLYADLVQSFKTACPDGNVQAADASKMKSFWDNCRDAVTRGVLIAGWNESNAQGAALSRDEKPAIAIASALKYQQKLPKMAS